MEPLKEMFNREFFQILGTEFNKVYPEFDKSSFYKKVTKDLDTLELNQRMRKASMVLKEYLPEDFKSTIVIMKKVIPNMKGGYTNLLFPDYVGLYGKNDRATSLDALKYFTQYGSSEFAIREFLKQDFDATIKVMHQWARDKNHHVRRLASEGCRPRLPWSFKLDEVIKDPKKTFPILEILKNDQELYVRKSVANHLNDFSKEHPEFLVNVVKQWKGKSKNTDWIIKHGSRTLLKRGHVKALEHFGVKHNENIKTSAFKILSPKIKVGDALHFEFELSNQGKTSIQVRIEYAVYFMISNGELSKKVFKISERLLAPKQKLKFNKKHSFKKMTTRKYFSGEQKIALIINGKEGKPLSFELKA